MDWWRDQLVTPLGGHIWLEIFLAVLCGAAIGLERQQSGKPVGMRTSMLICLGTVMFLRVGQHLMGPGGDPTRTIGQLIVGIGFMGGGVILTRDGQVTGMTSAACIWMLAAIGACIAGGLYAISLVLVVVVLGVVLLTRKLEKEVRQLRRGVHRPDPNDEKL